MKPMTAEEVHRLMNQERFEELFKRFGEHLECCGPLLPAVIAQFTPQEQALLLPFVVAFVKKTPGVH